MKKGTRKKIVLWFWMIILIPLLAAGLFVGGVAIFAEIPSFEELENPQTKLATQVLADDGRLLTTFHIENRSYVGYKDLSPNLVRALVATEDLRFYEHSGIDYQSLARVGVKTLLMGDSSQGGGSTITQQLAKSLYPRPDLSSRIPGGRQVKMVVIKLKEWITAVKLERNYTKQEIMAMYLNSIFYGSSAYGIKAAANTFFAKEPVDLSIEEAATLVGMVNKPTAYNPKLHYDKSLARRNFVIHQMNVAGFISAAECDSLQKLPIVLDYKVQDHNAGIGPYFRDMLRRTMNAKEPKRKSYYFYEDYVADSLRWETDDFYGFLNKNLKPDGSRYNIDKDGLKIYTTINYDMQKAAEEAIAEHLGKDLQRAFFRELRYNSKRPFSSDTDPELVEQLMNQARKWSDRYRMMKKDGASENEILESFKKPVKMRVFSWNSKGYIDTTMTPNDSIRYYKSLLRAAFVAMEPGTGHVKAYVGGPNYRYFKYDNASQGKRQVGSTIKPFLYTLAMQEGKTPCDKVLNVPQTIIVLDKAWTPASTDAPAMIGKTVTLKWGLTKSSNNISAYLMKEYGPQAMVDMMRKMGITCRLDPVPSLCVGAADIAVMEMISAYNIFPSQGIYISPLFVTKIEDASGNVIATFNNSKHEAISTQTASLMQNLMQGVIRQGTGIRLRRKYGLDGEISGKTGTTNDQSDGWFIGYTPKITAGVWVGGEDRQIHFKELAQGGGSNMALPIWGLWMQKVLEKGCLGITKFDKFMEVPGIVANLDCEGGDADVTSGRGASAGAAGVAGSSASGAAEETEEDFFGF